MSRFCKLQKHFFNWSIIVLKYCVGFCCRQCARGDHSLGSRLSALHFQSFAPCKNAVDHRDEIVGIDRHLAVEPLGPAEPGIGNDLRKAEDEGEDIALRGEAYGADTETA